MPQSSTPIPGLLSKAEEHQIGRPNDLLNERNKINREQTEAGCSIN